MPSVRASTSWLLLTLVLTSCASTDDSGGGVHEYRSGLSASSAPAEARVPPPAVVEELCADLRLLTDDDMGADAVARLALLARPFDGDVAAGLREMQLTSQDGDTHGYVTALGRTRAACERSGADVG